MTDDMMGGSDQPDKITVCIEIDADGSISVGTIPAEGEEQTGDQSGTTDLSQPHGDDEGAEKSYMRPAKSIDQALSIARQLLRAAMPTQGAVMAQPGGEGEQDAAAAAFQNSRGK